MNKMSIEVHSAKSGIIKDCESREDTVDQEVNKYVNVFSDISSDDNFKENAEIPDRHYVGQDNEAQGQLSDAERDNDVVASDDDLNDAEIHDGLYSSYNTDAESTFSDAEVDCDDVISISSDDEVAVAIPDEVMVVETFMVTVTRKTRIINGGVEDVSINVENDYFKKQL